MLLVFAVILVALLFCSAGFWAPGVVAWGAKRFANTELILGEVDMLPPGRIVMRDVRVGRLGADVPAVKIAETTMQYGFVWNLVMWRMQNVSANGIAVDVEESLALKDVIFPDDEGPFLLSAFPLFEVLSRWTPQTVELQDVTVQVFPGQNFIVHDFQAYSDLEAPNRLTMKGVLHTAPLLLSDSLDVKFEAWSTPDEIVIEKLRLAFGEGRDVEFEGDDSIDRVDQYKLNLKTASFDSRDWLGDLSMMIPGHVKITPNNAYIIFGQYADAPDWAEGIGVGSYFFEAVDDGMKIEWLSDGTVEPIDILANVKKRMAFDFETMTGVFEISSAVESDGGNFSLLDLRDVNIDIDSSVRYENDSLAWTNDVKLSSAINRPGETQNIYLQSTINNNGSFQIPEMSLRQTQNIRGLVSGDNLTTLPVTINSNVSLKPAGQDSWMFDIGIDGEFDKEPYSAKLAGNAGPSIALNASLDWSTFEMGRLEELLEAFGFAPNIDIGGDINGSIFAGLSGDRVNWEGKAQWTDISYAQMQGLPETASIETGGNGTLSKNLKEGLFDYSLSPAVSTLKGGIFEFPLHGQLQWSSQGDAQDPMQTSIRVIGPESTPFTLEARAAIGTTPTLDLHLKSGDLPIEQLTSIAGEFGFIQDLNVNGIAQLEADYSLSMSGSQATTATVYLNDVMIRNQSGEPLTPRPFSATALLRSNGLPENGNLLPPICLNATVDDNVSFSIPDVSAAVEAGKFKANAETKMDLNSLAQLISLTSQTLPISIDGAINETGSTTLTASQEEGIFDLQHEGLLSIENAHIADPGKTILIEGLAANFKIDTEARVTENQNTFRFRIPETAVETSQLTLPRIDWPYFSGTIAAHGKVDTDWSAELKRQRITVEIPEIQLAIPEIANLLMSVEADALTTAAGTMNLNALSEFTIDVPQLPFIAWQMGLWEGEAEAEAHIYDGRLSFNGERIETSGRIDVSSPQGEAPDSVAKWTNLIVRGDYSAGANLETSDFTLRSSGTVTLEKATAGGVAVDDFTLAWHVHDKHGGFIIPSVNLYGGKGTVEGSADLAVWPPAFQIKTSLTNIDLADFTENFHTGELLMMGRVDVNLRAVWEPGGTKEYEASVRRAGDGPVYIDKDSIRQIVSEGLDGTGVMGIFLPVKTLDRYYTKDRKDAVIFWDKVMVPFDKFEVSSQHEDGWINTKVLMENKHFSIDFDPNVEVPVVWEFLKMAQWSMEE